VNWGCGHIFASSDSQVLAIPSSNCFALAFLAQSGLSNAAGLAVQAHENLLTEGTSSYKVSMPSWDVFEHQPQVYRDSALARNVTARVAVERASTFRCERYIATGGAGHAMDGLLGGGNSRTNSHASPNLVRPPDHHFVSYFQVPKDFNPVIRSCACSDIYPLGAIATHTNYKCSLKVSGHS
jgi:hypothetical protein